MIAATVDDPRRTGPGARRRARPAALIAAVALLAVIGLVLRVHLLTHQPIDGDEAVAGLMANQVLHGHFFTFYWGNQYAGGEFYIEAFLFAIFGSSAIVLNSTAVVVTAGAAVLLWRAGLRVVPPVHRWLAAVAAAAFWVWPEAAVWNSTREFGFRQLTMAAGIAAIWMALRLAARWSLADAAGLGLAVGVGLWSSPEIIYFAVVAAVIVVVSFRWGPRRAQLLRAVGGVTAGFVVGALPWIWTNIHTGFASLSQASSPSYTPTTYGGRVSLFFHTAFPMMLGLRRTGSGAWEAGRAGQGLYALVLVAMVILCLIGVARIGRPGGSGAGACSVGLLLFPFEYAAFPATSFWQDGHYGVFVVPLVLLVIIGTVPIVLRARMALSGLVSLATIGVVVLTLSSYDSQFLATSGLSGLFGGGPDPNHADQVAIRGLEANHIRYAYADYWVAYNLDFLSHQRLQITDPSADRWVALYRRVRAAPDPAWIFYAPSQTAGAAAAFRTSNQGPFGYSEALFLGQLNALHVDYRVLHLGVLDAVITSRDVRQEQVGMTPPMYS